MLLLLLLLLMMMMIGAGWWAGVSCRLSRNIITRHKETTMPMLARIASRRQARRLIVQWGESYIYEW